MSAVRAPYGPTLPELLGPRRWRVVRAIAVAVGILVVAYVLVHRHQAAADEHVIVGRGALEFNYIYDPPLRPVGTKVQQFAGDTFVQSFAVAPLIIPAYQGDVGGTLPIIADRMERQLAAAHPGFQLVDEGRARINLNPGYYIGWQAKLGTRALFGRDYLLVPGNEAMPRKGAIVELLSTYAGSVSSADSVGAVGRLKKPLRSFRFGTERP